MRYEQQVGWNEVKTPNGFNSQFQKVGSVKNLFPSFLGTRVMMMPFLLDDLECSIPAQLKEWLPVIKEMVNSIPSHVRWWEHNTAYLTIDEKFVTAGTTQRNPGKHVDGMYKGEIAGAWGGGGGSWGSTGNGMLVASNTDDLCSAWEGGFEGTPVGDGDCEHLSSQCTDERKVDMKQGDVFWMDGLAVHESHATTEDVDRQFIRISLPSSSPWFVGYTENPTGVKPHGKILNERRI